jgi:hypothetical protein
MSKKIIFWLVILILVAIGIVWYILGTHTLTSSPVGISATNTSVASPTSTISITSTSSSQLSSFWYQGKQLPVGEVMLGNGTQADILPVQQATGTTIHDQKTYEWQGMQLENYSGNQTSYIVDGVTITNSDGKVSVTSNNESPLYFKTFADETGLSTFQFQGSEYFLESSQDCGQICAEQYYLIRRDSNGNIALVETTPGTIAPWWNGSPESDFMGAATIGDKLYLIDSQNNGIYTAILDVNGFERMVFTSSSVESIDLGNLVSNWESGSN